MSKGSDGRRTVSRTVHHGDTIRVRDENGVIVVEVTHRGRPARKVIKVPAGSTVEHEEASEQPQSGEDEQ